MDPTIWGPSYWFFLHNVAFNYPLYPTTIQKKIHFRLIHNFHEFLPNKSIAGLFVKLLEQYPITPYLDSKPDFIKWVHFMHNKINVRLDKPTITLSEHYSQFKEAYEPQPTRLRRFLKERYTILYTLIIILGILFCASQFKLPLYKGLGSGFNIDTSIVKL
jgi:hypothetical protein